MLYCTISETNIINQYSTSIKENTGKKGRERHLGYCEQCCNVQGNAFMYLFKTAKAPKAK